MAAAVAATLVVHGVALGSDFLDEDLRHLFDSQQLDAVTFVLTPYGNHFCAFFRLCAGLLHWTFGVHAVAYFAVMLATHALHVALLYGILRVLTLSDFVAAVGAGIWGATPAFQGSLQWFSAFSHMLAATAILYPLWELSQARRERRPPTTGALVRISIAVFLGAGTEFTGSLTAVFFPLLAFAFLPRDSAPSRTALLLLPASVASFLVVLAFTWEANSKAPWFFSWGPVLTMFTELSGYGLALLVVGPFATLNARDATWLFGVPANAALVASLVLLVPFVGLVLYRLVRGDWDERRLLLASVGMALLLYAAVAAGRSGLTFGQSLAQMATRDRYHYDASIGLVIALSLAVAKTFPGLAWPSTRPAQVLAAGLAAAWTIAGHLAAKATYFDAGGRQKWTADWTTITETTLRLFLTRVPASRTVYVRNDYFKPEYVQYAMGMPYSAFPGIGAYWIVAHGAGAFGARNIRFVEMDPKRLRKIRARSVPEVGGMFVSPREVALAQGEIRTIEADAPPGVAAYLLKSGDPATLVEDHRRANALRHVLEDVATRPALPFGPSIVPLPTEDEPPPPPPSAEEKANLAMRKAIEADPKAMAALREAFTRDQKAREALRKAMQKANEEE